MGSKTSIIARSKTDIELKWDIMTRNDNIARFYEAMLYFNQFPTIVKYKIWKSSLIPKGETHEIYERRGVYYERVNSIAIRTYREVDWFFKIVKILHDIEPYFPDELDTFDDYERLTQAVKTFTLKDEHSKAMFGNFGNYFNLTQKFKIFERGNFNEEDFIHYLTVKKLETSPSAPPFPPILTEFV
jgi:hypothetical protein